jgi:pyruvoyl-dependent arginine decarboxylase (PvlArgDC)
MSDEEMNAAVAGIAARFTLDPATGKWTREHKREKPTTDLVEISSKLVATMIERDNWEKTAADYLDGMHYYQGLVQSIGETIGEAAYIQDDGGKVDSVLCAKVPELVVELKRERDEARELRNGDNQLIMALAEAVGIAITCNPKMLGIVWEQFHDGVLELKRERDEALAERDIARVAALESGKARDRMVGEIERVYKERDELGKEKQQLLKIFDLNDLIFFTFRYFIGRMTIATVGFAEKLAEAYPLLSERTKILIRKELEQAYEEAERTPEWKPLGDPMDRRAWDLVKKEAEKWV